jgi:uncharacterized protein (DUF1015 family)
MAYVAPFRALRYDTQRVSLPQVVTQPYDKITPEMQERYYSASPNNLVRMILGKRQATDNDRDNVYTRASSFFQDWRQEGVFLQESQPCIYLYTQRFVLPGTKSEYERRGFIGLGRLEDYSAQVVFRHERTLAKPKADRLELLRATRAHFGQLFMLYSDPGGELDGLLTVGGAPDLEVADEYGVLHRVWRISDPNLIGLVRGKMRDKKLIIADGHHRYETALSYRDERRAAAAAPRPGAAPPLQALGEARPPANAANSPPYELVMMTFVNMDSPGLVILPTHRVVHGLASFSAAAFRSSVRAYFAVEEVDASIDAARATAILREAGHIGTALLTVTADAVLLLHSPKAFDSEIFAGLSPRQQSLDVVQLHKCLLDRVLGLSEEAIREQRNIAYLRDADQALLQVRGGSADVAFLMNPVRMEQVRDIAFAGEVLPQKSTDFYPKLLSGLTIYALE